MQTVAALQNLNNGKNAPTVTEKISNAAQSVTNTASDIKDTVQELSKKIRK